VRLRARSEENGMILVSVSDNGIGIAEDMLPRVFDLFFQGKRDVDHAEGGLGIGLALVKNLIEMHGGHVSVASAGLGKGSEFTIHVPGAMHAHRGRKRQGPTLPGESAHTSVPVKRRVLLVDDNVDGVLALSELLKECGHEVQAVCDPVAALQIVRRFKPDMAVIDIGLPVMDGYELVGRLRTALREHPCLFVALTGYGQDADRDRSQGAGFAHHFVKPLDPGLLLRLIEALPAR
jgi:CheY-like chemotaxis protein